MHWCWERDCSGSSFIFSSDPNVVKEIHTILCLTFTHTRTHADTHTRLTALFLGLPGWAGTRKAKPSWILLKQETVSGSGISWAYASLHLALHTHAHTHTHMFNGPFSGTTRVGRYRKGETNLDFTEARDSEWQWHQLGICKSAPCSRQITTPAPHHSVFLQAGCPSCRPTNSVKALKACFV